MNNFVIIIITTALLLITAGSLVYPFISFRKMAGRISGLQSKKLQPLFNKLESRQTLTAPDIYDYAKIY